MSGAGAEVWLRGPDGVTLMLHNPEGGLHETDVATDVRDNPAERGEMSVGAERPELGWSSGEASICSPASLPGPQPPIKHRHGWITAACVSR